MLACTLAYSYLHTYRCLCLYASVKRPYFGDLAIAHQFSAFTIVVLSRNLKSLFTQLRWWLVRIAGRDCPPLPACKMISCAFMQIRIRVL